MLEACYLFLWEDYKVNLQEEDERNRGKEKYALARQLHKGQGSYMKENNGKVGPAAYAYYAPDLILLAD